MNNTQSIIVYRSPAEAMLWEGGYVFPLLSGLVTGFLVFLCLMFLIEKCVPRRWAYQNTNLVTVAVSIVSLTAGVFTFNYLFI